jgi:hypothetical protein
MRSSSFGPQEWKSGEVPLLAFSPLSLIGLLPCSVPLPSQTTTSKLGQDGQVIQNILQVIGSMFIFLGLALMVWTNRLFTTVGNGTLAPWNPPQKLVVRGV